MRNVFVSVILTMAAVGALSLASEPAIGQASTTSNKPWNPPRTPDGTPDMQGVWANTARTSSYSLEATFHKGPFNSVIVDPPDGKIPLQPWAAEKKKEIFENEPNPKAEHLDPQARCYLDGVPRIMYQVAAENALQILQVPGYVVFLHEWTHAYRVIPLDQRPTLGKNLKLWMGDSRGRWDGDTLIVDATHFNDKNWFDVVGTFHSDALHVVERFTLIDIDTIHYEATIEDPKVFTRPWKIAFPFIRIKDQNYELMEHACYEGERDVPEMLRDNFGNKNQGK